MFIKDSDDIQPWWFLVGLPIFLLYHWIPILILNVNYICITNELPIVLHLSKTACFHYVFLGFEPILILYKSLDLDINIFRIALYIQYAWNLLTNWYIYICIYVRMYVYIKKVCLIYRLHNSAGYFWNKKRHSAHKSLEFLPIKIRSHWASASVSVSILASMMTYQLMFQAIYSKN